MLHARGQVDGPAALAFGSATLVGSFAGARLAAGLDEALLAHLLALVTLGAGIAMAAGLKRMGPDPVPAGMLLGPHEFDPSSGATASRLAIQVRQATALVGLRSLHLAPLFDRLYPWARAQRIRIVELDPAWDWSRRAPAFPLLANPKDSRAAEAPAGDWNPHVWLAPSLGAEMARRLGADFTALDPRRAKLYGRQADGLARRLLDLRATALAALAGIDDVAVASLTEGFPYLTADLGVEVRDYILDEQDPARIEARLRESGVRVVLAEVEPAAEISAAVGRAGARILVLDTLEHGWGGGDRVPVDGYERGLADNLDKLVAALGGRRAPR